MNEGLRWRLEQLSVHAIAAGLFPAEWSATINERQVMFERFTDRARRAVVLSDEITREVRLPEIGTVALLAGLLREGEGVAAQALAILGVTETVVLDHLPRSDREVKGHIPFTPQTKRVLELSLREALQLGHNYIGTEHILLALIREDSDASRAIQDITGASPLRVREAVIERLGAPPAKPAPEGMAVPGVFTLHRPSLVVHPALRVTGRLTLPHALRVGLLDGRREVEMSAAEVRELRDALTAWLDSLPDDAET